MLSNFDIANVTVFIEKSGDKSIIGSWNRIKTELRELGTSPNNESVPSGRFLTKDDWPLKQDGSILDRYLPDETAHIS